MATPQYRIRLKSGSAAYANAFPRWASEDSSINTVGETGEMYFRDSINIKLTFQKDEFDLIHSQPIGTEFRVQFQEWNGSAWQTKDVSRFWKSDVDFDVDNRTCEVTPKTFDIYEKVIEGLEKEFDLIELAPPTIPVNYLRQAVFQVYFPGAEYIANFTDGVWWEEPCTPFNTTPAPGESGTTTNHDLMLSDYGFGLGRGYNNPTDGLPNYARIVIPGSGLSPDVSGVYYAQTYNSVDGLPLLTNNTSTSYIREDGAYAIVNDALSPPGQIRQLIKRVSDGATVYTSPLQTSPWSPFGQPPHASPNQTFTSSTSASTCEAYLFLPYVRLITNIETIDGTTTTVLPTDDPFPHGNFLRALPIETLNFEFSAGHSTTSTRWGKFSADSIHFDGEYFTKPTATETLMPALTTTWTGASAWFWLDNDLRALQQEGSEPIKLIHSYKISDVIDKLLEAVGSTAGHGDGVIYSQFLYNVSNAIRGSRKVIAITPKSNVLVGNYDQPAKKAPIRLKEVLDMLKIVYNAYWFISESNFVIEHENYFHNGKSYATQIVGTDLTTTLEPRTGLRWGYRTSKFKYDKETLPERMEFRWMDNVSKPFEGYPIQVNSTYVNKGQVEQKQVQRFTSDIDFFNVAAADISKEGFVLFDCVESGTELDVPFVDITVSTDETYKLQNGYASFLYCHETYHKHNLPAESVNLNGVDITATTTVRAKTQELEFALNADIDPYQLIETDLGVGRVNKIEQNLSSKQLNLSLKLDTE